MSVRAILVAASSIPPFLVPAPGSGSYTDHVNKTGPNGTPYNPGSGQPNVPNYGTGLWRTATDGDWYNTNFSNTDMGFWNGKTIRQSVADPYVSFGNSVDRTTHYAMELVGYWGCDIAGTWTWDFCLVSDDQSMMWIGDLAISGYDGSNRHTDSVQQINPNSLILTGGLWYPIRIWYNEIGGANSLQLFAGRSGTPGTLYAQSGYYQTGYDTTTQGLNPNNYHANTWTITTEFDDFIESLPQKITATTAGLIDGTTGYWRVINQANLDNSQFVARSGAFQVSNNQAQFTVTVNHSNSVGNPQPQWYQVALQFNGTGGGNQSNALLITDSGPATFKTSDTLIYFDAGNSSSYPGTGSTWTDLSAYGNNATLTNFTYDSSYGGYITFASNGSGAMDPAKWNQTYSGKTVFVAARFSDAPTQGYRAMVGSATGNRNFNFYMHWDSGLQVYQLHYSAGGTGGVSNPLPYSPGDWFVAAVSHDSSGVVTYYFNGEGAGSNTNITFNQYESTSDAQIANADTGTHFDGDIAVLAVYTVALNETQIRSNFATIRDRYGL